MQQRSTLGVLPKAHGTHDMILPILSRVLDALEEAGRGDQVDLCRKRAEACRCREELVRVAREYVGAKERPGR